jgi:hypothetical protein
MPIEKDIEAIKARRDELKGGVESHYLEYNKLDDADPRKVEVKNMYNQAREGVIEAERLLAQREVELSDQLVQKQNRIFGELATPSGAGFKPQRTTRYIPTYGVPGVPSSYEQTSWKWDKKVSSTVRDKLAEGLMVDKDKINMFKNVSAAEQISMRAFSDPQESAEFLKSLPDVADVQPMKIGGEDNYLVKDIGGSYYLGFRPGKGKAEKIAAGTIAEAPRIAAGLGMMAVDKAKGLVGSSLKSSLGYEGVEAAQEGLLREVAGMKQKPGEAAKDAAIGTAVNLAVDTATFGVGRGFAKRTGTPIIHEGQKAYQGAVENIKKKTGQQLDDLPSISGGPTVKARFSQLGRFPGSAVKRQQAKARETLNDIWKGLQGEKSTPAQRAALVEAAQREYDDMAQDLVSTQRRASRRGDKYAQASIKRALNKRKAQLATAPDANRKVLGEALIADVQAARQTGRDMRDEAFGGFFQQADEYGITMNRSQVASELDEILSRPRNKFSKDTRVHQIVAQLKDEAGDAPTMSLEEFRGMVDEIGDSTGARAIGASTPQKIAQAVDARSRELMISRIADTPLADSWSNAVKTYDDVVLAFNRSSPAKLLADQMGDVKISNEGAVNALLQNSKNLDDYMGAMYATGDGLKAEATRKQLQSVFVEDLGTSGLQKKKPLIDSLWGRGPDGAIDAAKADRAYQALLDIQKLKSKAKTTFSGDVNKAIQQVDELSGFVSQDQRDKMLKLIAEREMALGADNTALQNAIIKKAKGAEFSAAESDSVARALWGASKKDVDQVLARIQSPATKQALRQDMRSEFFREFASPDGVNVTRHGDKLPNADKIMDRIGGWKRGDKGPAPELVAKMDAFGDKETTDLMLDLARAQKEAVPTVGKSWDGESFKAIGGTSGGLRVWVSETPKSIMDAIMAYSYGTPGFKTTLRLMLKDPGSEAVQKGLDRLAKGAITTRLGMEYMTRKSAQNPHFAADFQDLLADIAAESAEAEVEK